MTREAGETPQTQADSPSQNSKAVEGESKVTPAITPESQRSGLFSLLGEFISRRKSEHTKPENNQKSQDSEVQETVPSQSSEMTSEKDAA